MDIYSPLRSTYGSNPNESLLSRPPRRHARRMAIFLVLNAVAIGVMFALGVVMHSSMTHYDNALAHVQAQHTSLQATALKLEEASGLLKAVDITDKIPQSHAKAPAPASLDAQLAELRRMTAILEAMPHAMLPTKFAAKYITPHKNQVRRGTCWDFATISYLEWSYRQHGVMKGFLNETEYVALSEQAYGTRVINLCAGPVSSPQQVVCRVAGDEFWNNSTEGGESSALFYLEDGLKDAILPEAVCPYIGEHGPNDTVCDGMDAALRTNPIQFEMKRMFTYYDDMTAKRELVKQGAALDLSTSIASVTHYYPCIDAFYDAAHCAPSSCTLCPASLTQTTCCVPQFSIKAINMEGEYLHDHSMTYLGGHGMLMVGYNDAFLTQDGYTGGFILKNSWADGPTQGSHSIKWWLQDISDWEERILCPNSHSPMNFYACGNAAVVGANATTTSTWHAGFGPCMEPKIEMFANVSKQPLHLDCSADMCRANATYFVKNSTDYGDKMYNFCLWELDHATNATRDLCLKPNRLDGIAKELTPRVAYINDPDLCGFYFMPYETLRAYNARYKGLRIHSFDMTWADSSFVANKAKFPQYDYTLLKASTKTQRRADFPGPFPFAEHINFHAT
ncbi:hypothetical protein SPRG_12681 [Saprolegnia parasitica CBS 223.65]|uniref:Peptidase C1A papain C-terminal domain-containing protein n=1 Tax=Saprolegnia parasitica (strain CBS 223.65) TaxID=695850 RepID=A0A067BZE1_SAPPC|nr:hypothetical protein SPRG_12681 [Saprolegnia parasitica CBS 223.65]KDO22185.1 hypothetical protein SPRG_12681 [Saprolegnia parasitica CBS 223.65]|eukprot:XP_012207122.1 hypothetical protein SPRG_12681 [Saprolegnia parasitica CBS 223.65]